MCSAKTESGKKGVEPTDIYRGRRLDPAELEERSKKGLCFKCGDKWNMDHTCKFKHMSLRLCESSSEEEEGVKESLEETEKESEVIAELKLCNYPCRVGKDLLLTNSSRCGSL